MKSRYALTVKNNVLGKVFFWWFKRHLNTETYSILKRGRHPNRVKCFKKHGRRHIPNGGNMNDVPVEWAKYWAIYLNEKR